MRSARSYRAMIAVVGLCMSISAAGADDPPPPSITFSAGALHATNITVGGEVVIFAALIDRYRGLPSLARHLEVVGDADGDGAITFTPRVMPESSVWAVVDFASGRYAISSPAGDDVKLTNLTQDAWRTGSSDLELRRDYLEVLVVRPGVGVWSSRAAEGGANDHDGSRNTVLRTRLAQMTPLVGTAMPQPPVVIPRDVMIAFDPHSLEVFARGARE